MLTDKQLKERLRYWVLRMGLEDYSINVEVFNDVTSDIAASIVPEPQYKRATMRLNVGAKDFNDNPDGHIKHELAHLLVAMLVQAAFHSISDTDMRKVLNDLEDEVATRIERMPALAE